MKLSVAIYFKTGETYAFMVDGLSIDDDTVRLIYINSTPIRYFLKLIESINIALIPCGKI